LQSILISTENLDPELLTVSLWEGGTTGILQEGENVRAFFDDGTDLSPILTAYAGVILEKGQEKAMDLQQFERADWEGIAVGSRFFVAPTWARCPIPEGRIHLAIDTTVAFGTGRHESTQLAIEALERHLSPGATLVDIGCGSGILSLAASLLGARQVISCDLDTNAITSARQVVSSPVFLGSADALRPASADVVVANISAHVADSLAGELSRIVKPGGLIILAGFVRENPPKRWVPESLLERGGWLAWICRPGLSVDAGGEPYLPKAEWW
jgi:ribosomal protein L11 methyltransferase